MLLTVTWHLGFRRVLVAGRRSLGDMALPRHSRCGGYGWRMWMVVANGDSDDNVMVAMRQQWWGGSGGWASSMVVVVVVEEEENDNWWCPNWVSANANTRFGSVVGWIPFLVIPCAFRPCDSWNHSTGIVLSIWQVPVPKLIPLEFRELPGFCRIPAGISGGQ